MKSLASVFLVLLLTDCASTSYINDKVKPVRGDLRGMVYDLDRVPVPQVTVRLEGTEQTAKTDVHGHFLLPDVPFGTVHLVLDKAQYETYQWTLEFGEVSQVVYVQMADAPQLFDAAADALEQRQWDQTRQLLDRAQLLEPDSPMAALLGALLASRQGKPAEGVALLEAFLVRWPRYPVLELAAADLYERELKDPVQALVHLEAVQALRYDPEVDLRIRALKGGGKGE